MKTLNKQVMDNNEFVRKLQAEQRKYMGNRPNLTEREKRFNAVMTNTGESARDFAKKALRGWDKLSYPIK